MNLENKILSDVTVHMKYAKYLDNEQRRENWDELVTRNMNMHIKKFPHLESEIRETYQMVYDKKVLPSMRSMQFGGKPIEVPQIDLQLCLLPIDDPRVFGEICFFFSAEQVWIFSSRSPLRSYQNRSQTQKSKKISNR